MFFGDLDQVRAYYFSSWRKFLQELPLDALEQQVVAVIQDHPEYHAFLANDRHQQADFFPELGETNPFLHMGLHLALREQISTNRPPGINFIFQQLLQTKQGDSLRCEHCMMECLAEALWLAQKNGTLPDETAYLEALRHC